jgi:hypothetical protein
MADAFPAVSNSGEETVVSSPWLKPLGGSSTPVSCRLRESTVIASVAACWALETYTIEAGVPAAGPHSWEAASTSLEARHRVGRCDGSTTSPRSAAKHPTSWTA